METPALFPYLEELSQQLAMKRDSAIVIDVSELAIRFESTGENPLSEDDVFHLRTAFFDVGLSSEPDISKCYRKLDLSGKIAIYKSSPHTAHPISAVIKEKIFFSAIALFAKADGIIDPDEIDYIHFCRKYRAAQSGIPLGKISAISEIALTERRHELRARIQGLAKHFPGTEQLLEFFANVIIADGHIDKREIYTYCEIIELTAGLKLTPGEAKSKLEGHARTLHKKLNKQREDEVEESSAFYMPDIEFEILDQIFSDF